MNTYKHTYIYHIYTFNLTINNMFPLKNTFQERSFCVTPLVLTKKIKSKRRFFSAIIIPWFYCHCHSTRLLILLIAKHQNLLSKISTRNKLEHLIT